MSESKAVAKIETPSTPNHRLQFFEMQPSEMVAYASELATILKDIIIKQKLSQRLGSKEYVKHEGWATLGTLLGIMPREVSVVLTPDKSFVATVQLVEISTDRIVGQASSLCGMDEDRWSKGPMFARRSMSVTRATGKAYRLGFGWIMHLAGYEATPAEEMDHIIDVQPSKEPPKPAPAEVFSIDNQAMNERLGQWLEKKGCPELHPAMAKAMNGKMIISSILGEELDKLQIEG
jgi:hypothetical protein